MHSGVGGVEGEERELECGTGWEGCEGEGCRGRGKTARDRDDRWHVQGLAVGERERGHTDRPCTVRCCRMGRVTFGRTVHDASRSWFPAQPLAALPTPAATCVPPPHAPTALCLPQPWVAAARHTPSSLTRVPYPSSLVPLPTTNRPSPIRQPPTARCCTPPWAAPTCSRRPCTCATCWRAGAWARTSPRTQPRGRTPSGPSGGAARGWGRSEGEG